MVDNNHMVNLLEAVKISLIILAKLNSSQASGVFCHVKSDVASSSGDVVFLYTCKHGYEVVGHFSIPQGTFIGLQYGAIEDMAAKLALIKDK